MLRIFLYCLCFFTMNGLCAETHKGVPLNVFDSDLYAKTSSESVAHLAKGHIFEIDGKLLNVYGKCEGHDLLVFQGSWDSVAGRFITHLSHNKNLSYWFNRMRGISINGEMFNQFVINFGGSDELVVPIVLKINSDS